MAPPQPLGELGEQGVGVELGVIDEAQAQAVEPRGPPGKLHLSLHRRGRLQQGELLRVADLVLDPVNQTAQRAQQSLTLTRAGFVLLEALMRRAPHLVRHAELAHALWGEGGGDIATLHTHLSVLRSIIDRPFDIHLLHTVHGFGYRISE